MKLSIAYLALVITLCGAVEARADYGLAPLTVKLTLFDQGVASDAVNPTRQLIKTRFTTKDLVKFLGQSDVLDLDSTHHIQVMLQRRLPATGFDTPDGQAPNRLDLSFSGSSIVILDNGKAVVPPALKGFEAKATPNAFGSTGGEQQGFSQTVSSVKTDRAAKPGITRRRDRSLQAFDWLVGTSAAKFGMTLAGQNTADSKLLKPKTFLFSKREWDVTGSMMLTTVSSDAPPIAESGPKFVVSGVITALGESVVSEPLLTTPPATTATNRQ